jgi:uncharacterized protein YndB with AHSA1/START domain
MEFDVARHLGAMTRKVVAGERDGQPTRTVIAGRSFATDIADAWDALTSAERIPRWFSPVEGELKLGGRYQIQGNAAGTITECEPPRRLALTWEFGGGTSWVYVTLSEEDGDSTRLELEHEAIVDEEFEKFWGQFGPGAVGVGWDLSFLGLAEHLESGWDKPPETDTEWPGSENGKAFIGGSSEGWRAASVAFGTDPAAAKAAADRTYGFYTGTGG